MGKRTKGDNKRDALKKKEIRNKMKALGIKKTFDYRPMNVIDRMAALESGSCHYYTGNPCINGHLAPRFVDSCTCVECAKNHVKSYRERNPNRGSVTYWRDPERGREWSRRRRARKSRAFVEPVNSHLHYLKQRGKCKGCEVHLVATEVHLDHIMPLSKGGLHSQENTQLLCADCNRSKGAKLPNHWKSACREKINLATLLSKINSSVMLTKIFKNSRKL